MGRIHRVSGDVRSWGNGSMASLAIWIHWLRRPILRSGTWLHFGLDVSHFLNFIHCSKYLTRRIQLLVQIYYSFPEPIDSRCTRDILLDSNGKGQCWGMDYDFAHFDYSHQLLRSQVLWRI